MNYEVVIKRVEVCRIHVEAKDPDSAKELAVSVEHGGGVSNYSYIDEAVVVSEKRIQ